MAEAKVIRPQDGYQMKALSSSADIVIGGAAAGVGKTFCLLLEFLRHIDNKGWGGVIFRRTSPQIRGEGGLWDTSLTIYPLAGGMPKESSLEWVFKKGAGLKFSHLEYEKNILDWQGTQIPFIGFDELTHFTKKMFFYLLTRSRSVCGVTPYVRATCNPDPSSWVYEFIEWWIDPESGLPIPERDGLVRYFTRHGEKYIWGNTFEEVVEKAWFIIGPQVEKSGIDAKEFVKSVSFVSGSIYDNRELLKVNPAYLANLVSQDEQTKMQLLDGNWKVVISDTDIYDYYAFIGMFEDKYQVDRNGKYITADIALKGSDKFIIGYWEGYELMDIMILAKSDGKEVIFAIEHMAKMYKVQNANVAYDNDGVGGFVDGFIKGALPFSNGGKAMPDPEATTPEGREVPENYQHLKAQCFYRSGRNVKLGKIRINEAVADKMYDDKMTVRQRLIHERKAIKRDKVDMDGKLRIIKKEEMKVMLNGQSPDLMDMLMMREVFNLKPKTVWAVA